MDATEHAAARLLVSQFGKARVVARDIGIPRGPDPGDRERQVVTAECARQRTRGRNADAGLIARM
jgi:hypothetical protein